MSAVNKSCRRVSECDARVAYLAMGPSRTLRALADKLRTERGQKSPHFKTLGRWSASSEWQRLATDHDERLTDQAIAQVQIAQIEALADAAKMLGIDQRWVLSSLKEVVERCMASQPVLDRKGNPTGIFKFNGSEAIRALQAIGTVLGMFRSASSQPEAKVGPSAEELAIIDAEVAALRADALRPRN